MGFRPLPRLDAARLRRSRQRLVRDLDGGRAPTAGGVAVSGRRRRAEPQGRRYQGNLVGPRGIRAVPAVDGGAVQGGDPAGPRRMSALVPRADFPALAELTYLNTASIGLVPLEVQQRAEEFDRALALRGSAAFDEAAEVAVFEGTRASAARLIGAQPDEVAITASATLALGQIAWFLRPGRGENIVSVDFEFPSSTYPWLRVAEDTGAEVRLVQRRAEPSGLSFDDVAALVDGRTRVLCVSHVQYATGHRFDPGAL